MHISQKCSVAVHCLVVIIEAGHTEKITSEVLAASCGCNPVTVRNILSALKKDGIISVKPGLGGATIKCTPEEVSLYRICNALDPDFSGKLIGIHRFPSTLCPVGRNIHPVLDCSYQKVREDLCESLRSVTMADVIADYHRIANQEK